MINSIKINSFKQKAGLLVLLLFVPLLALFAQQNPLPDLDLKTLDGEIIKASDLETPGTPLVIIFWNESDYESYSQLEAVNDAYEEYMSEMNIKMIAIYVGKSGTYDHIKPLVDGNNWEFDVYVDVNGSLQRSMCLQGSPHTLLYDQSMSLVSCYPGYCKGTDALLQQQVNELLLVGNYHSGSDFSGGPGGF